MSVALADALFAVGGGCGALARHAAGQAIARRPPLSTLLVNVLGSLVLGIALVEAAPRGAAPGGSGQTFLIGFCGGFTTFSSFAVQSLELRRSASTWHLIANVLLNLGLCTGALALGAAAGALATGGA